MSETINIPAEFVPDLRYGILSVLSSDGFTRCAERLWGAADDGDGGWDDDVDPGEWEADRRRLRGLLDISLLVDRAHVVAEWEGVLEIDATDSNRLALVDATEQAREGRRSAVVDRAKDVEDARRRLQVADRADRLFQIVGEQA